MEKKKFRATLSNGPFSKDSYSFDCETYNSDEVIRTAYRMNHGRYSQVTVEEIPEEPTVIGIEFKYTDTVFKKDFVGYLFIKAKDEAQAKSYYNHHYKGNRFWFNAGKIEADGKCVYGNIKSTYFAACSGFCADATVENN